MSVCDWFLAIGLITAALLVVFAALIEPEDK